MLQAVLSGSEEFDVNFQDGLGNTGALSLAQAARVRGKGADKRGIRYRTKHLIWRSTKGTPPDCSRAY